MVKIPITLFSLLACTVLFSQGEPTIKLNPENLLNYAPFSQKPFDLPNPYFPKGSNLLQDNASNPGIPMDTAQYSHSNSYGLVYTLPGSNMPILKPGLGNQVMPGTTGKENEFTPRKSMMPNGLQLRGRVFEKPPVP